MDNSSSVGVALHFPQWRMQVFEVRQISKLFLVAKATPEIAGQFIIDHYDVILESHKRPQAIKEGNALHCNLNIKT